MRNPVNAGYECPFINSVCRKKGHWTTDPYPVCTVVHGSKKRQICVCPKRFFHDDLVSDVLTHCWTGERPQNPQVAYEVSMADFGTVDFVIADIDPENNSVRDFISVELQAVDLSGSVEPAYSAIVNNTLLDKKPSFGVNWGNVRKRYVSQLISKAFYHHHWNTRMVAVMQTALYEEFRKYIPFDELPSDKGNVVFMLYDYQADPERGDGYLKLVLNRSVATSHNSLMTASLYRTPPPKENFHQRILDYLKRP